MSKIATFTTETGSDGALWLCANDLSNSVRLARFESFDAAKRFTEMLALAKSMSHAQGSLGI
jgi:hypothetical protein